MLNPQSRLNNKGSKKKVFKDLKKPLGRGLESLLGEKSTSIKPEARIWNIALHKMAPSRLQPRKIFEKSKLLELANSIKQHGVLQPITVKKVKDSMYEILAGERRWRASQMAGLRTIPAIVKKVDQDSRSLEIALIENIQRENLNPMEEAHAYNQLLSKHKLTQEQISKKVGKDRATIANTLRLLKLDPQVQEWVGQGDISTGHAKLLLGVKKASQQKKLGRQVITQNLSVRQLEQLKAKLAKPAILSQKSKADDRLATKLILRMAEDLQKKLGTKVQIEGQKGRGRMTIHYYSNEQLTELFEKLTQKGK